MAEPFEALCALVDEFWKSIELPVRTGPPPVQQDAFYLKLYWFGILNRCPEKRRYLERAEVAYPHIFKKRKRPSLVTQYRHLNQMEPLARQFWHWLQRRLQVEKLLSFEDVLLDATTIEAVLFARVNPVTKKDSTVALLARK